jgi:chemotaxis signal transduction protein
MPPLPSKVSPTCAAPFYLSSICENTAISPPEEATKNTRIIVITIDTAKVGMIVDAVSEVLRVSEEAIELTPPIVITVDSAFITGIA